MGKKISVKNRSAGSVVYSVPDMKVRRDFQPGEVKVVDSDELRQLSYTYGGSILIHEYLQILDREARDEMNGPVEPEYNYTEEDVKKLILAGSLDSFLDALDFAPAGVIDMIKDLSVSLPMVDMNKMQAVQDKLGFNVRLAIENNKADEPKEEAPKRKRRVAVPAEGEEAAPKKKRRTTKKETPEA